MTKEEETLLLLKGAITEFTDEQRQAVDRCAVAFREILANHPGGEAMIAFALVGAELQAGRK